MPRHPDTGRVRRYCIYYNLSGIISQQLSQECKKNFQIPGGLRQKMGDWREKMGVFPSPPPHQRDWNNIKVSPAFSKAAGARGQAPVKQEREAFPRKGEQTEKAIHPVDGSPERFCGPPCGEAVVPEQLLSVTQRAFRSQYAGSSRKLSAAFLQMRQGNPSLGFPSPKQSPGLFRLPS